MTFQDCIPKDKYDEAAVHRAERVGFPALNPILPDLLIWIQDINWPVAQKMYLLLARAGPAIVPHIREVFQGDDGGWKYFIITWLMREMGDDIAIALRGDLLWLIDCPSADDCGEEVDQVARDFLDERFGPEQLT